MSNAAMHIFYVQYFTLTNKNLHRFDVKFIHLIKSLKILVMFSFSRIYVCGWNHKLFWAQMTLAYRLDAISQGPKKSQFPGPKKVSISRAQKSLNFQGPKKSQFPGPNPLPLALIMDAARIKSITHGAEYITGA